MNKASNPPVYNMSVEEIHNEMDNNVIGSNERQQTWNHHDQLVHFFPVMDVVKHPVKDEIPIVCHNRTLLRKKKIQFSTSVICVVCLLILMQYNH